MKILSINITEFGGLRNFKLELSDSLNVIRGDNESGKSTILLFVSYILYGLSKSSRKSSPDAYDKQRSLSWSGSRAAGSIDIEVDGIRYRIERENVKRTSSSEAVITDIDAGTTVHIGEVPGEVFLGVSKETFESCLWCGQARASAINGDKLSETLSNLSLTADESVNGDAVLSAIREARKQYKHERGNGGRIFETEERITEASMRAARINAALNEGIADRERYERLKEEKTVAYAALERAEEKKNAVSSLKILARMRALGEFKEAIIKDKKALAELEEKANFGGAIPDAQEYASAGAALRTLDIRKKEYDATSEGQGSAADIKAAELVGGLKEYQSAAEFCENIKKRLSGAARLGAMAAALGISACLAAVGGIVSFSLLALILFVACGICATAAVAVLITSLQKKKGVVEELARIGTDIHEYEEFVAYCFAEREKYLAEMSASRALEEARRTARANLDFALGEAEQILGKYGRAASGDMSEALSELIADIGAYISEKRVLAERIALNERIAQRDQRSLDAYDEEELRAALPEQIDESAPIDEEAVRLEYQAASERCKRIDAELVELKIKIESSGTDVEKQADVKREIELLQLRKDELVDRYNVLDRAYRAVEEAYSNMRRNFAPRVRDGAGKYLDGISGGKYDRVFLSENFDVSVDSLGKERAAGCLSGGTSDAVYIALRLSLIENIFDGSVPLFMDETLSTLDDRRASSLLSIVSDFVKAGNQCLIFSCHRRESELCQRLGIDFNLIEL